MAAPEAVTPTPWLAVAGAASDRRATSRARSGAARRRRGRRSRRFRSGTRRCCARSATRRPRGRRSCTCCRSSCRNSLRLQGLGQGVHGPRAVRLDAALPNTPSRRRSRRHRVPPSNAGETPRVDGRAGAPPRPRSFARSEPGKPTRRRFRTASGPPSASSVSRMSKSPSSPPAPSKSEKLRTTWLRTFWRRNQSIVALDRMRWNSSGSSAAGRSAYFSDEPDHRVLDDVERGVVVADGVDGALPGTLLDALQKVGKFFVGRQGKQRQLQQLGAARLSHRHSCARAARRDERVGRCDNCRLHDSFRSSGRPKRGGLRRSLRHRTRLTRARKGAPMVFRQRNSQR